MKTKFKCEEPKKLICKNYSNFSHKDFASDLLLNIGDGKNNYLECDKNFVETLNKHAPKKTKIFRGNHKPHITKPHYSKYKKQRNYVDKLNNTGSF